MAKDDYRSLSQAADDVGVSRQAIATWVRLGLLDAKTAPVPGSNLTSTLVSVAKARELAKVRKPGRPRKSDKG
jgi:hypothetical protein